MFWHNLDNISNLRNEMENIHEWFVYNSGKTNLDEFQFIAPPPPPPSPKLKVL